MLGLTVRACCFPSLATFLKLSWKINIKGEINYKT